ncbi:MAG: M20/M25/M40 family metallo-hydrolase [bacterium]|nr:MAG: M20/M25/M40 family metallo-hydrolase [bacterium]
MDPVSHPDGSPMEHVETGRFAGNYLAPLAPSGRVFEVRYGGVIRHPLQQVGQEYARGQKETVGSIGPEGVYLDAGSGWYPRVPAEGGITFELTVRLPPGWDAVSQGTRAGHTRSGDGTVVRWVCESPQDGIWLVAGRYTEYSRDAGDVRAMVFLREDDADLASKYLEATGEYIAMYESLIGSYPYGKFALVENFWETGYGMPSFTLLGPRVIRFPFIIESSYPHEILHNWWGNSVFIDYGTGNWGEGLTAYLSDHLIKEQKGLGAQHRQETLQKYADYVLQGRDIPLTEFRSRHGSVTEAVGYGKTLMLFHMLRLKMGDEPFRQGLRRFFADNLYRTADFQDLRRAFEAVSQQDLGPFFRQWVTRTGAPALALGRTGFSPVGEEGGELTLELRQLQEGQPYRLRVPVAVTVRGKGAAHPAVLEMTRKEQTFVLNVQGRPLRVDVDPQFDLFRRLDRRETPPALTMAFGAEKALVVLPSGAAPALLESYRGLAQFLSRAGPGAVRVVLDTDLPSVPADASLWVLGWENRMLEKILPAFSPYGVEVKAGPGTVDLVAQVPTRLARAEGAVVMAGRHPGNADLAVLWIADDNPASHPGLARKLPHYHKYSYLAFAGDEPENVLKGRWPVVDSPLTRILEGREAGGVPMGELPPRQPVVERPIPFSAERMLRDIRVLAGPELEGRRAGSEGARRAADHIAGQFREAGLQPGGEDGGWFTTWTEGEGPEAVTYRNVVAVLPGSRSGWAGQSVVVGAHYDHLGTGGEGALPINSGRIHPGADDNASGVAVMLELARVLAQGEGPGRSLVFAAFTGEEQGRRGSLKYVSGPGAHPTEGIMGMVNLDTVGRLGDGKLLLIGGSSAEEWVHIFRGAGYVAGVEVQMVSQELDASDQVSFIDAGVPAVQLFAGAHLDYHKPSDTVELIDAPGLVKVAAVAKEAIGYLAGREEPLTGPRTRRHGDTETRSEGRRKVSLGTVPDFAFEGEGVRLDGTVPGSPAERAGLRAGDVIRAMNGRPVRRLREFSDILKESQAGDGVRIELVRDGMPMTVEAILEER